METFSALLALCAGNLLVAGEFPSQRPVTWRFYVFFHLRLNKRSSDRGFETQFEQQYRYKLIFYLSWFSGELFIAIDKHFIDSQIYRAWTPQPPNHGKHMYGVAPFPDYAYNCYIQQHVPMLVYMIGLSSYNSTIIFINIFGTRVTTASKTDGNYRMSL